MKKRLRKKTTAVRVCVWVIFASTVLGSCCIYISFPTSSLIVPNVHNRAPITTNIPVTNENYLESKQHNTLIVTQAVNENVTSYPKLEQLDTIGRLRSNTTDIVKLNESHIVESLKYTRADLIARVVSNNEHKFYYMHKEWLRDVNNTEIQAHAFVKTKMHDEVLDIHNYSIKHSTDLIRNEVNTFFNSNLTSINHIGGHRNKESRDKTTDEIDTKLSAIEASIYRKHVYDKYHRKIRNQGRVNCSELIQKNVRAINKARNFTHTHARMGISAEKYAAIRNCNSFKRKRGYIEDPLSEDEKTFPLAYAIIVYKDVEQAERLLRAIYRPQNYYCFHVDVKTTPVERKGFDAIASCFDNVYIAPRSINVTWGTFSVLETELVCMELLWKMKGWRYYINLTGQEFPLKTNLELVKILDAMEGANVVDGTWIRARQKYFYRWTKSGAPPPHMIRPIKGSVHVAINRDFVDFCLHDVRAKDFLEWLKKTEIPDETFFASLNHNPQLRIPGTFLGEPEEYPLKPSFTRYKNWRMNHNTYVRGCAGKYVHNICILGVGDLHKAYNDIGLFVNKFHLDFEYLALDCLEEILYEETWHQYITDAHIDVSFYKHLDQVKYKLTP